MSFKFSGQQPIARTVGRRTQAPAGVPPSKAARAALDSWMRRRTRTPKGVFRYTTHADMERDRDRWRVDAIVAAQAARA